MREFMGFCPEVRAPVAPMDEGLGAGNLQVAADGPGALDASHFFLGRLLQDPADKQDPKPAWRQANAQTTSAPRVQPEPRSGVEYLAAQGLADGQRERRLNQMSLTL